MSAALDNPFRIGAAAAGDIGVPVLGPRCFLRDRLVEHVERHVEHDRTRAAGHHGLPRLAHRDRQLRRGRGLEHALAVGAHRRREIRLIVPVGFLERAAVELAGRDVARHRVERHGVEERVGEADRQIRRAGPAGGERCRRLARHAVINVGHETGDALVMHGYRLDLTGARMQRVDEPDVAVAAQPEDVRHFLPDQVIDDDARAVARGLSGGTTRTRRGLARRIH